MSAVRKHTIRSVRNALAGAVGLILLVAVGSTIVFALFGGFSNLSNNHADPRTAVEEKCRSLQPGGDFTAEDTYGACMILEGYTP